MFNGNIPTPKSLGGWPKNVNDTDDDKLLKSRIPIDLFEGGVSTCPDCNNVKSMLVGPEGGLGINIMCKHCRSKFNFLFPFGVSRVGEPNPRGIEPVSLGFIGTIAHSPALFYSLIVFTLVLIALVVEVVV